MERVNGGRGKEWDIPTTHHSAGTLIVGVSHLCFCSAPAPFIPIHHPCSHRPSLLISPRRPVVIVVLNTQLLGSSPPLTPGPPSELASCRSHPCQLTPRR
jgi:hypothetical protein